MTFVITLEQQATLTEYSDEQLVALCRHRWPVMSAAFTALIQRYQPAIYRFCLRYLRNESDAWDASQEVFTRVFRHLSGFVGRSSFRTWLYRIAQNQCHSLARQRARYDDHEDIDTLDEFMEFQENRVDDDIEQMLRQLPAPDRDVLQLRFYQDLNLDEIAAALEIGLSATKMRLYRALERLREIHERM